MAEDPGRYQALCTHCGSTVGARLAPHPRAEFVVDDGGELAMRLEVARGCEECGHTAVEIPVRRRRRWSVRPDGKSKLTEASGPGARRLPSRPSRPSFSPPGGSGRS